MHFRLSANLHIDLDQLPHGNVARALKAVPARKLAIVVAYAVGAAHGLDALSRIATALDADIYAAPFHVQGTVDALHPNFRGQLPPTTKEINETLSRYMLLVGEKVDSFTYDGRSAMPSGLQLFKLPLQPVNLDLIIRATSPCSELDRQGLF